LRSAVRTGRAQPGAYDRVVEPASVKKIEAVVFDLDGVLVDSEEIWDEARRELALERGLDWPESAQRDMMGMSSLEWSRYMHERVGLGEPPEQISAEVVKRLERLYRRKLPLFEGAEECVLRMAAAFRLGLASSSNRPIIDLVLELSGLAGSFEVTVSSEEVARGKPAPDVYLEALRRMDVAPERAAAIEDSTNGILAVHAAGMLVVAIPNHVFPPRPEALVAAGPVLGSLAELSPETLGLR
jgi:HAD superfamily hydrolase (TIGR01509 family)